MLMGPQNLPEHVRAVRNRIELAAQAAMRNADSVTLVAVTKGHPANMVRAAAAAGLRDFGESYVQEALEKIEELRELPLTWHFIGRLQANKTRAIAANFAWVHAVDRLKIAARLSEQRPFHAPLLNVCLQVNIAGESTKGGVQPAELPALAAAVAALPRLKLRGLMCIPPEEQEPSQQQRWFAGLRHELQALNDAGAALDTLSMGMSSDFETAIQEGATMVRVGTALFGPRPSTTNAVQPQ